MAEVPIVDFSILGVGTRSVVGTNKHSHCDVIQVLSKDLYESLSTTGFVYIKNHGIDENKVNIYGLNLFTNCICWRNRDGRRL